MVRNKKVKQHFYFYHISQPTKMVLQYKLQMWETPKVAQLYTLYCRRQSLPSPLLPPPLCLSLPLLPTNAACVRASVAAFQASLVHRAFARSGGAAAAKGEGANVQSLYS